VNHPELSKGVPFDSSRTESILLEIALMMSSAFTKNTKNLLKTEIFPKIHINRRLFRLELQTKWQLSKGTPFDSCRGKQFPDIARQDVRKFGCVEICNSVMHEISCYKRKVNSMQVTKRFTSEWLSMKKLFATLLTIAFLSVFTNASQAQETTIVKPISNGAGSESVPGSFTAASIIMNIESVVGGNSVQKQREAADKHDKDYYNGEDRKQADRDFQRESMGAGTVVRATSLIGIPQKSYEAAQQDRRESQRMQPTWEQEHQQSLDKSNYRVEERLNEQLRQLTK